MALGLAIWAIGLSIVAAPADLRAQIYQWTDDAGTPRFAQDLEAVPPAQREAAKARWDQSRRRVIQSDYVDPPGLGKKEAAAKPGGLDEAAWRQKLRMHLHRVRVARDRIAQVEARSSAPGSLDYSRRARNDRSRARWERNRALRENQRQKAGELAAELARLAEAEAGLEKFIERARRAGVPPGWVRVP